jgi:hypothetical protein
MATEIATTQVPGQNCSGEPAYLFDVRSGACKVVNRAGEPALGNSAQPGG